MSAAGDLRAVLTLDDFEYLTGLREAAVETDKFAQHAEHAGHSMHRAIHKGAHIAGSVAFMASEGKGIEDMKSKLEQIDMMIPMIGLSIGGWAGPISIAAGVVGAALIPKLLEGREAWDGIAEGIKESDKALSEYIKRQQEMIEFQDKIKGTNERKEFGKTEEDLDKEMRKKQAAEDATMDRLKKNDAQRKALDDAQKAADDRNSSMDTGVHKWISDRTGIPMPSKILGMMAGSDMSKLDEENKKERQKLLDDLNRIAAEKKQIEDQKRELEKDRNEKEEAGAMDPKFAIEQSKKLLEQEEKRRQLAERIGKEIEDPYDKAQSKIRELTEAYKEGLIDQEMLKKGSDKEIKDYEKSIEKQGKNEGAIAGSSESYKQIRESVNSQNKVDDEKVRLLKEQAESAKKTQQNTERIADNIRPLDVEGIA